jgi:alkanesulfonate monooxygenase SsuD/methylene tetrahydromethanopterin reductase-like flavin-dependent oxidoreductase (luciferase family)
MKFGVNLLSQHEASRSQQELFRELVEQAQLAESVGFDAVFLNEHHPFERPDQAWLQPLPSLAALATVTNKIRLGTNIAVLPLYHPVRLAEDVAMINAASGGRFILGAGIGYKPGEFAAFGVKKAKRAAIFEEQIHLIRTLWTEPKVSFAGQFFDIPHASLPIATLPPPPPIWVGAEMRVSIERAARIGDAWLPADTAPIAILKDEFSWYDETRAANNLGPPNERPLMRETFVHAKESVARSVVAEHALTKYREYWRDESPQLRAEFGRGDFTFDELARDRFIVGDPQACVDEVARYSEELGVTYLIFRIQKMGMTHADTLDALRLIGEHIIPEFE